MNPLPKTDKADLVNTLGKSPLQNDNPLVSNYITNVAVRNESTAAKYNERIKKFQLFVSEYYGLGIGEFIKRIMVGKIDVYNALGNYILYLKKSINNRSISPVTLKNYIITIKNFLEYSDIDISPRKFKLKIRLPKVVRKNKEALSKEDVIDILNACSDIRLKTYVMFLAAGGFRAVEALSVRGKDLDFESKPTRVLVRGEYTKTKVDRIVFLTEEMSQQLITWLDYKYRKRRVCYQDYKDSNGRTITEYRTPRREGNELIFAVHQSTGLPNPVGIYDDLAKPFAKTLDRIGKGERENGSEGRRRITLHSFRRFVKTTISDLGYSDFSEYFIGHSGSAYWQKKDSEKAEIFRKIEPYLTFLDPVELERKGADLQTKVDELEIINQKLRDRDAVNNDAIATLSDKLAQVIQEIEILKQR
ncbi:MAG: site-specific integrase [Candidatus Nitrosopolaris sp.]